MMTVMTVFQYCTVHFLTMQKKIPAAVHVITKTRSKLTISVNQTPMHNDNIL